jgi:hypothetical protein
MTLRRRSLQPPRDRTRDRPRHQYAKPHVRHRDVR